MNWYHEQDIRLGCPTWKSNLERTLGIWTNIESLAEEEGGTGVEYEIEVTILESNLPMLHDSLTRENITIEKYPDLEIGEYGKIYFNSIHTTY